MADDPNYTYDFSAFQQAAPSNAGPSGMSFMGGAPAGGFGGGAPAGAAGGGAPGGGAPGGQGGSLSSLLGQSPFGPLLNLPGVTAENLFSNVNPADYAGGNPFASLGAAGGSSGAYGGNPFANIGQSISAMVTGYPGSSSGPASSGSAPGGMFGGFGA